MKSEKPMIKRFVPWLIALAVLVLVAAIAVPTIAYYIINSDNGGSEYTPAKPSDPSFYLNHENNKMENVRIAVEDNGYPVYVRVAIVITWQQPVECANPTECDCADCTECVESAGDGAEGEMECPKCNGEQDVYYVLPEKDVDYTIEFNANGWEKIGNYYYCTSSVAGGATTEVLINSCVLLDGAGAEIPDEYVLSVEIIVQTVQAIGSTDTGDVPAWRDAWNIGPESWN